MSRGGVFDPEASLAGFRARTRPSGASGTVVPAPPKRRASTAGSWLPPFGSLRGNRVAYTVNLPAELALRLDLAVAGLSGRPSYGAVAVDAVRTQWASIREELERETAGGRFPYRRLSNGRLPSGAPADRKVFYVTPAEADAIAAVRHDLGGIEVGQLHRIALDGYLPPLGA